MRRRHTQQGLSGLSILVILIVCGFFVMCGLRMVPKYIEYLSVKKVIEQVASEHDKQSETTSDIRRRLSTLFNTNQIYAIPAKEIEVYREDGVTYIDASYEARVPIFGRIDAVMKFDDLKMVAGEPTP